MAYDKTTNLQLDKIGDDNIFDPLIITSNFEKVDDAFGKIKPDTSDIDVTCTSRGNKKLNEVLTTDVTIKGEILPQDIKGNNDKRIYKYVRIADENSDKPYLWTEYVNSEGRNVTNYYRFADMKFFSGMRNDINNLKLADTNMLELITALQNKTNSIETELNGKVTRLKVANDTIETDLNKIRTLLG